MAEKTNELNRSDYDRMTAGPTGDQNISDIDDLDMTGEQPQETEHIRLQIEETRAHMGETIDELQERLSFANLSEQVSDHVSNAIETAKNTAYDATIGKAVGFMKNMGDNISDSRFMRSTRNNPVPLILIGLGAGWLAYNLSGKTRRPRTIERYYPPQSEGVRSGTIRNVQEKLGDVTDKVSNAASSAYESASDAMNSAYDNASDLANRAYSKAGEYGNMASDKYDQVMRDNPLVLGAAAFAVGATIGLAMPSTRYEGRLMGETRDDLLKKAQDTGSQLLDKTKQAIDEAAQTGSRGMQHPTIH
jgi:hypothetical protein